VEVNMREKHEDRPADFNWSAEHTRLYSNRPRQLHKRYGKNPTPEQVAQHKADEKEHARLYRHATKMMKAQIAASNAALHARDKVATVPATSASVPTGVERSSPFYPSPNYSAGYENTGGGVEGDDYESLCVNDDPRA
jgi:hypothetical protein